MSKTANVAQVLRAQVAELERIEADAPQSARDIIARHGVKERHVEMRIDPRTLGTGGFDGVRAARREAARQLAADLLDDRDFQLHKRCSPNDFMIHHDVYRTALVAMSPEQLERMLQEAFRAGRES